MLVDESGACTVRRLLAGKPWPRVKASYWNSSANCLKENVVLGIWSVRVVERDQECVRRLCETVR